LQRKSIADVRKLDVGSDPAMRLEMIDRSGPRTVPQFFIGDTHVGGFDDLAALDRTGRLDEMLR
jgi:glutaredoxin 3